LEAFSKKLYTAHFMVKVSDGDMETPETLGMA